MRSPSNHSLRIAALCACFLLGMSGKAQEISFYKDILPLVQTNCQPCHREDGAGPFPLESYQDVAKRANFIRHVTEAGVMPPWKADPSYRSFSGQMRLSKQEIEQIAHWVNAGAPKGKKKDSPAKLDFGKGSQMPGKPDLVLRMQKPFEIPGNNEHTYICYKIPFELAADTFGSIIEFLPGNRKLTHHMSYQILEVADDVDVYDSPDYFVFSEDSINAIDDDHDYAFFNLIGKKGQKPIERYHNGWLPGTSPQHYPPGIGFKLPRKGVLLVRNLHYSPTPIPVSDQSAFQIWFAPQTVEREVRFAAFKPTNLKPGDDHIIQADTKADYEMNIRLGGAVSLLNINPHMHLLGSSFLAYAITPSKDTVPLVHIPDWDFNWQEFYRFPKMLHLPAKTVIHAEATFDNTANNPDNPFDPPQDVFFEKGSMEDTEEMMRLVFLYLPYRPGDEAIDLNYGDQIVSQTP